MTWLRGSLVGGLDGDLGIEQTEAADADQVEVILRLPEGTPDWNDSTLSIQRIHDVLVGKGWGNGPY